MAFPQITRSQWFDIAWLMFFGIVSSAWSVSSAHKIGPTFDEPIYLEQGLAHWRDGSYFGLLDLGTMPLPIDVNTGPLYLYEQLRGQPIDVNVEMATILPWARASTLLFWWLLLIYGFLLGRRLAGVWGGAVGAGIDRRGTQFISPCLSGDNRPGGVPFGSISPSR